MNKTIDEEDALEVITSIMKDINQTYLDSATTNFSEIQDVQEKLSNIGPLDIYKCLPQTGCGDCGEATCTAFAMKLLIGDTTLDLCPHLMEPEYMDKLQCMEELLGKQLMASLGWNVQ